MEKEKYFISNNEYETIKLGKNLGKNAKVGQIILLKGDLGSGKTRFVKGIAGALNLNKEVSSPTYNLINEYPGKIPLYHMDLYRLDNEMDLLNIGFEDYLYRDGIVVIEWPELAYSLLPEDFLLITFEIISDNTRKLKFEAKGKKSKNLMKGLAEYVNIRD
ncbi:MAG: tRNA (adenosine(37)-N6)-threonylcarbamoyltransferase complex ATPase subunit type 1 TsaE [Bacillota bacterium]